MTRLGSAVVFALCALACGSNEPAETESSGGAGGSGGSAGTGGAAGTASSGGAAGTASSGGAAGTASSGGAAGTGGTTSALCTGQIGGSGLIQRTLQVGGVARKYELYLPGGRDPSQPLPMVLVHHGFTMSGDIMRTLTAYTELADEIGIIVAFPDGVGTTWNVGSGLCGVGTLATSQADDFGFVERMIDDADGYLCVDRQRTFLTGFSMGGYFANNIGCRRPDLVHAVAPHSGGGPPTGCVAGPMPVMVIHGTLDPLITYNCGKEARDSWVAHNNCGTDVDSVAVKGGTCEYSKGCPDHGQVVLCSLSGMGHGWAGHVGGIYGGGTQFEDATRLTWNFFASQ